jgi:hypothetical protein
VQTSRHDRVGDLLGFGGGEQEEDARRRLLEDLQKRVEGRLRQHVDFVHDEDLVPVASRGVAGRLAQGIDVLHLAVRRAVDLDDIHRGAGGNLAARIARSARVDGGPLGAVERAGEEPCQRGLAHAARAGEQVRVVKSLLRDGVLQRRDDAGLSHDLVEALRTVLARENLVRCGICH